jgi:hypothetical protein
MAEGGESFFQHLTALRSLEMGEPLAAVAVARLHDALWRLQ